MKTNVDLKPLERLDFSKVNTRLPDWPDHELLTLDKVQIKDDWNEPDEPEIGHRGIIGSVLSIVGAVAAPYLIPALPGLGFLAAAMRGGAWYSGLIRAGLGAVGSFIGGTIGNIISPAAQPSFGNLASPFRDQPFTNSPTFSLKGIQNMVYPDGPVPIVYGQRRVGGVLISRRLETVGDDTFYWGLYLLSEGEVGSICAAGLVDLHINEQPGTNFSDVTLWTRTGTHTQTVIPGFEELTVSYSQNSKLTSSPVTYTTISSAVIGFRLKIEAPSGIYSIGRTGGVGNNSAIYKVEYRVNGDPGWIDAGNVTMSAAKVGTVRDVFLKQELTADKYDVRITRVSAEQTGAKERSDIWFVGIDELTGDEFVYPHCALGAVKIKATNQLSGPVPTVTFLLEGIKTKDVTNLGAAKRYSQNPADGYYDLITRQRYGLGRFIATTDVNNTQIAVEAAYFNTTTDDGDGGTEVRSQMDIVIDTHSDAQQLLVQLMSSFRASPLWSEGLTSLVVDRPKDYVHIFNMGNIIKGSYASSFPDIKKAPNRIMIQFPNEDNDYKLEPISVTDDDSIAGGKPIRTESIMAAPVTRRSEIYRLANYKKNISKYITRAEEHGIPPEALDLQAGDTYLLQHDVPLWGWGGRIENVTGAVIVVDQELVIEPATSYVFQARLPDGTLEERAVTNSAETTKVITLASAFSTDPNRMTPYFFGETTNKKVFTCVAITMSPDGNRRIAGVEYNVNTYDEITLLPTHNASALPTPEGIPPDIENLTLFENQAQPQSMIVSFNIPDPAQSWNHAVVELSSDGGNTYFPYVSVDNAADVVIKNLLIGTKYWVRMPSFSRNKIMSASPPTANITITGSPFTPPTVRGLEIKGQGNTVTFTGKDVTFTWKKNNPIFGVGVDGAGDGNLGAGDGADSPTFKDYKVDIYVSSTIVRTAFVKENSYRYTEQMNIEDNSGGGVRAFQLRVAERNSFNKTGGESILDVNNPAPDMSAFTPALVNLFDGIQVDLSGYTPTDKDFEKYEIYMDTNNPPTTLRATFDKNTKQITINGLDASTIYYVQVKPYDVFGVGTVSIVGSITSMPSILRDRNLALDGIEISAENPVTNRLYWTAGNISYIDNAGDDQTVAIAANNVLWVSGTLFLYWVTGEGTLSTSTNRATVFSGDNVVIATYKGADDMTVVFGRVIVDGSDILAGSIFANQLTTTTAVITVAAQIANAIITNAQIATATITAAEIAAATITAAEIAGATITAAEIASATITDAEIDSLNADKIVAGTMTGRTIRTAASGSRVQMDTTELVVYKGSNKRFEYNIASGDLKVGDYDNSNGFMWDESTGVFKLRGYLKRTRIDAPVLLPFFLTGSPLATYTNSTTVDSNYHHYCFGFQFILPEATTTLRVIGNFRRPNSSYTYHARFEIDGLASSEFEVTGDVYIPYSEDITVSSLSAGIHTLAVRFRTTVSAGLGGSCMQSINVTDPDNLEDTGQTFPLYRYDLRGEFKETSDTQVHEETVSIPSGKGTVTVYIGWGNGQSQYLSSNKDPSFYMTIGSATSGTVTDTSKWAGVETGDRILTKWNSTTIDLSGISGAQTLKVYGKLSGSLSGFTHWLKAYFVTD